MINKYNWKLEIKRDIDSQIKNVTYSKNKSIKNESNKQEKIKKKKLQNFKNTFKTKFYKNLIN